MRTILALFLLTAQLIAAPALGHFKFVRQSDGEVLKLKPVGNQFLHWFEDENDNVIVYNHQTKQYEYATIKNERLVPSGMRYTQRKSALQQANTRTPIHVDKSQFKNLYIQAKKRFEQNTQ